MEDRDEKETLDARRIKGIDEVLEAVEFVIDTHFFNQFQKSPIFPKRVIANQKSIETNILKRTRGSLIRTPKTMKTIREIKDTPLRSKREK